MLVLLGKPALREPRRQGHSWDGVLGRLFRHGAACGGG